MNLLSSNIGVLSSHLDSCDSPSLVFSLLSSWISATRFFRCSCRADGATHLTQWFSVYSTWRCKVAVTHLKCCRNLFHFEPRSPAYRSPVVLKQSPDLRWRSWRWWFRINSHTWFRDFRLPKLLLTCPSLRASRLQLLRLVGQLSILYLDDSLKICKIIIKQQK